jgi:ribonucleoside-diphosphate reductase beta chain
LATQLADEARHVVFLNRVYQEVIRQGGDGLTESLAACEPWLSPAMQRLVGDDLPTAAKRLRRAPEDIRALVEAVTLYHLVIEAGLGMTCLRAALRGLRKLGGFSGICAGFAAMLRDEKRHVLFGVRFLRDMLAADAAHEEVIATCLDRSFPVVLRILERNNGEDSQTSINYAVTSMRRQLSNIGLERPWSQAI